ncbi:hypothetical protein F7725_001264 [Dissostichus mawsoni]|uniref:ZP domain-containing protein n=1 Tax=Dissostichus mawsoni TaxID=36200 RepID=A0A7J5ZJ72_DISMA|nr:hypothetical protein F7725_001264 [Dissostichus mawsoni]
MSFFFFLQMKGKHLIYKNELTFRPRPRSSPAAYVYPIECVYPRCLLDSVKGNSRFLPRYHSSAIILYLQSFKFGLGEEVRGLNDCCFLRWELLDDPMQSSMCDCCSRTCNTRSKRGDEWAFFMMKLLLSFSTSESNGFWHTSVLGPLIIMDPSQQNAHNASEVSIADQVYKWCHFLCDLDHSVMGTQLYLGVIVVTLFATTVANAEIKVQCEKDSISITLTIPSRLRQYAARYFLGNCMPSRFNVLPSGEGKAEFNYKLADCNFKRLMKGKHLIYKNELTFRPRPRSSPAAYVYPIECVYPRCLLDSVKGNSRFLPRYHSSAIILYLQSFKFGLGEEVRGWELLDDPMQSSMCDCCSRTCNTRSKRGDEWESNGFWHTSVLGPLIIMDPSQQNAHNASEVSIADQVQSKIGETEQRAQVLLVQLIWQGVYKWCHFLCDLDHSVMGTQLYLGVIVVTLFATTVANAEIKVQCEKDSISITLTIPSRLRQYAARYFLGNCMPSRFNVLPSGEGKAEFNYKLADCNFKRLMKGKHLIYKNELTFRPRPRSSPAAYVYPIECVYPR